MLLGKLDAQCHEVLIELDTVCKLALTEATKIEAGITAEQEEVKAEIKLYKYHDERVAELKKKEVDVSKGNGNAAYFMGMPKN